MKKIFSLLFLSLFVLTNLSAQNDYFFPGKQFNPNILTPDAFLGYSIGTQHTRYDRLVSYFEYLSQTSDRVKFQTTGRTYEYRSQLMVAFSSPENLENLESIRKQHLDLVDPTAKMPDVKAMPVIMQLGYNVHGNEASGGEASILTAYYLAACEDLEVQSALKAAVIFIEPVINPDGRDRFVNWVNMHKGMPPVSDPNDREHNEVWPSGRVNHYWFDLNRDWFLAVHRESRNRLNFYHQWYPNVVTDHHEMGTNSTHFFEPSKQSAENPLVPGYVYRNLNDTFAKYFEEAMNEIGSLYYTKESFDNLYPGYGSSYPDIEGGIGFLFEQGSSRGHVQDSQHGVLTFGFAVRNHLVNAIATIKGGVAQRENLLKFQREFFETAVSSAQKSTLKGYVVGSNTDATTNRAFLNMLLLHRIEVYPIKAETKQGNQIFKAGQTYYVPVAQPQYRMVQSIFEKPVTFTDSIFYDASAWNLPLAYGLPVAEVKSGGPLTGNKLTFDDLSFQPNSFAQSKYAYLLSAEDFNTHKALYQLVKDGYFVKVGQKPFRINTDQGDKTFGYGTLIIPVQTQKKANDAIFNKLKEIAANTGVNFYSVKTGYSTEGVDLGSNNFGTVKVPKVLMPIGAGTSQYEAGEVWYMLDNYVGMPITKVDLDQMSRVNLNDYDVMVMVNGQYPTDAKFLGKVMSWVETGGTLITFKSASEWVIKNQIAKGKIRELKEKDSTATKARIDYEKASDTEGSRYTGGAIFSANLDITNPLGFGYTDRKISLYRNSNTLLELAESPYNTVIKYDANPLLNGYVHPQTLQKIANSAGLLISSRGRGNVIMFSDNPNFRGTWLGTSKLFFNALFYGNKISTPNITNSGE
ncbi:M14 family zinc carboxypeptidase [Persicitalea sp.]|uniref:M14 family zinc carboxypeptidase n=1 Tax=Persicitalea sp. TaxID=3100273 RepID=UPI003593705E